MLLMQASLPIWTRYVLPYFDFFTKLDAFAQSGLTKSTMNIRSIKLFLKQYSGQAGVARKEAMLV